MTDEGETACEFASAWDEVLAQLEDDEPIEAVVFGHRQGVAPGGELVPASEINKLLSPESAAPLMDGWKISGATEPPQPMLLWTDRRIFSVAFEPRGTRLTWAPRDPTAGEVFYSGSRAS